MWAIPTGASWLLKKKKGGPVPESRVPETGSDPPIGSGRGSGRDTRIFPFSFYATVRLIFLDVVSLSSSPLIHKEW